jgi:hypothetical protein
MVLESIRAVAEGNDPKGLILKEDSKGLVKLDSFVGIRD